MGSGEVAGVLFNCRGEFNWARGGPEVLSVTLGFRVFCSAMVLIWYL